MNQFSTKLALLSTLFLLVQAPGAFAQNDGSDGLDQEMYAKTTDKGVSAVQMSGSVITAAGGVVMTYMGLTKFLTRKYLSFDQKLNFLTKKGVGTEAVDEGTFSKVWEKALPDEWQDYLTKKAQIKPAKEEFIASTQDKKIANDLENGRISDVNYTTDAQKEALEKFKNVLTEFSNAKEALLNRQVAYFSRASDLACTDYEKMQTIPEKVEGVSDAYATMLGKQVKSKFFKRSAGLSILGGYIMYSSVKRFMIVLDGRNPGWSIWIPTNPSYQSVLPFNY